MSKRINVNPDHYKVAGRERQGENILIEKEKMELRRAEPRHARRTARGAPQKKK